MAVYSYAGSLLSPGGSCSSTNCKYVGNSGTSVVYYDSSTAYMNASTGVAYGGVWNDYAEFREISGPIPPAGSVVIENGDDSLSISTKRLQPGANIISDTFGFAVGDSDSEKMAPIAVSGRVLANPFEDRTTYHVGDVVCSAENGTVSKMTTEEIELYPDCIIGYVTSVPKYETWGQNNINVGNRIWVEVK